MKIWGMSYGLIGDLVMGLPLLTYFEKKYPKSYKYWVIQKKCHICAPLYLNHPLIDRIKITDEWNGFGNVDRDIMSKCDIVTVSDGWKHSSLNWYNKTSCVEETAYIAGINDIKDVLNEEELKPKLYKWFDVGYDNPNSDTYSKSNNNCLLYNNIAIYPFATAGDKTGRSPSLKWWRLLVNKLIDMGYTVSHYGRSTDPKICDNEKYFYNVNLSYFDQVKVSLSSKIVIGTDSGSMWTIGAYNHPAIHLITNWLNNHTDNFMALAPVNYNAINLFEKGGCDNIKHEKIIDIIKERLN